MKIKRHLTSLWLIFSLHVWADTEPLEIVDFFKTNDCGQISHEVNLDPGDSTIQCLRLYFQNFSIHSSGVGASQRNCHMSAKIRIPAHTQFRATDAVAEGSFKMDGQGFGGLTLNYALSATKGFGRWLEAFQPKTQGDFNFTVAVNSPDFTPCYGYDTEVVLSSDLHAFIDQVGPGYSLLSLDETGKRLSWNWKLKSCQADLFNKPFVSYYQAPNGRQYPARIVIDGEKGSFQSAGGFNGSFFGIRRSENGFAAEGKWKALGVQGIFYFHILNATLGTFEGYWKDELGRGGNWWGEYE